MLWIMLKLKHKLLQKKRKRVQILQFIYQIISTPVNITQILQENGEPMHAHGHTLVYTHIKYLHMQLFCKGTSNNIARHVFKILCYEINLHSIPEQPFNT